MGSIAKKSIGAVENSATMRRHKDLRTGAGRIRPTSRLQISKDAPHREPVLIPTR